jgi:hypothetical protein
VLCCTCAGRYRKARFGLYGVLRVWFVVIMRRNAAERSYDEVGSRRRDDAGSKIEHETNNALTLSGHARTPSGCKSGDIKRTIIKKGRRGTIT